jgi:hypothetical protein
VKRSRRNKLMITGAVAALSITTLIPGRAAAVTKAGHSDSVTVTMQTVATGLNVPRGLVYDPQHNRLLIAEAGVAADDNGPCAAADGGGTLCYGDSGSVYSYSLAPGGQSGRIITGLPSEANPAKNFVKGLEGLSLFHGQLTGVFSLSGTLATRTGLGPGAADLGQAVTFGPNGSVTPIADVAAKEAQLYGTNAATDLWGVTTGYYGTVIANEDGTPAPGTLYGGNDILQLNNGNLTQMVAFPQRVSAPNGNATIESAPDTVVQGPDGAFYVGELTSYPYYNGAADIWRVVPGQTPTLFASGFTKVGDLAFTPSGQLLVLEQGHQDTSGSLVMIAPNGTQTTLASTGLVNPVGVAVVNNNTFYVTNVSGGVGGDGELLKITVSGC